MGSLENIKINDIKKRLGENHYRHSSITIVDHFNKLSTNTNNNTKILNNFTNMLNRLRFNNRRKDKLERIFNETDDFIKS